MSDRQYSSLFRRFVAGETDLLKNIAAEALRQGMDLLAEVPQMTFLSEQVRTNLEACLRFPVVMKGPEPIEIADINAVLEENPEEHPSLLFRQNVRPVLIDGGNLHLLNSRAHSSVREVFCESTNDLEWVLNMIREVARQDVINQLNERERIQQELDFLERGIEHFPNLKTFVVKNLEGGNPYAYAAEIYCENNPLEVKPNHVSDNEWALLSRLIRFMGRVELGEIINGTKNAALMFRPREVVTDLDEIQDLPDASILEETETLIVLMKKGVTFSVNIPVPSLRELVIGSTDDIRYLDQAEVSHLNSFENLTKLGLESVRLPEFVPFPDFLSKVEELDLESPDANTLAIIREMPNLIELTIQNDDDLTAKDFQVLSGSPVEKLSIGDCGNIESEHLATIARCEKITHLDLTGLLVTDEDLQNLTEGLHSLIMLDLSCAEGMTRAGLEEFKNTRPEVTVLEDEITFED